MHQNLFIHLFTSKIQEIFYNVYVSIHKLNVRKTDKNKLLKKNNKNFKQKIEFEKKPVSIYSEFKRPAV